MNIQKASKIAKLGIMHAIRLRRKAWEKGDRVEIDTHGVVRIFIEALSAWTRYNPCADDLTSDDWELIDEC